MTATSDETQIGELVDHWAKAAREKDMDGVLAHHADDVVMFDVPLPLQCQGIDEYRKTWELFFDSNRGGPGSFDVTELRITASSTVAYVAYGHALLKVFSSTARLTIGFRKECGQWVIAHEHHSYPLAD